MSADFGWFDMDGSKISTEEYVARTKADPKWRIVARTDVGERHVSTVLLGFDPGFGDGTPIIFETMTFPDQSICERYATREQAEAGHLGVVVQVRNEQANLTPDAESEDAN